MSAGGHGSPLPFYDAIHNRMHNAHEQWGVHATPQPYIFIFILITGVFFFIDPFQTIWNFEFLLFFSPLWLPLVLFKPAWERYIQATRYQNFKGRNWVLLEIRIPREITKTPAAMETFINNLHIGSGESNWYKKYINGATRPWFSFELVSIGGRVHFYVWTLDGYRRLVETYLYAQYPEVEVIEAEDYSRLVDPSSHDWSMWGTEFKKTQANPLPIKTYQDYGIIPGYKPEENIDPLSQLIEFLGSMGPGEQFWIQYIFRMSKTETYAPKLNKAGKPYTWKDEAEEVKQAIRDQGVLTAKRKNPATGVEEEYPLNMMTEGQKGGISAVENNTNKQAFDVGIRAIYCAPKDNYQGINIPAMLSMFKPFSNEAGNGLTPQGGVFGTMFNDYPWEDPDGSHAHHAFVELLKYYRQRMYFFPPYKGDWSIYSSTELATLFHIPDSGTTTPNLPRIGSSTASAPANLPT